MRKALYILSFSVLWFSTVLNAQDTFSIVAVDSVTGEVGSAGASCVDMFANYPNYPIDFLSELLPGLGGINSQSYYLQQNQINARNKLLEGLTPTEVIEWLDGNDVENNPGLRQYGIVAFVNDSPESAAYTGNNNYPYANHITGTNYSIQGNILLGAEVLEQMEANFISADGDLACRLMAALQGANMVGADIRCESNGTSSLFAFIKVAQPGDTFGEPSFSLGLKTHDGAGIEPIDSLQVLFDEVHDCGGVGIEEANKLENSFKISPNPAQTEISITSAFDRVYQVQIVDEQGKICLESSVLKELKLDISNFENGMYLIIFANEGEYYVEKLVKQ